MIATPYLLLAAFGFVIYRGFKKIQQAEQSVPAALPSDAGEPPPSASSS
jgi:hypothetical protein